MKTQFADFIEKNREELFRIHKELCLIPAPSHFEDARAEYCKKMLIDMGATGVLIDEAKNVVFPMNCEGSDRITLINAHTDTVFPMETPLPFSDDGKIIRCPGVGDDTGCLAVMLMTIRYLLEVGFVPKNGILFVCNSCEEGLGNLKGTRQIFKDYAGRIARHIALDGDYAFIADACVGSHRYEVTVTTEGGHSFSDFGNTNAIAEAAKIISEIYKIEAPKKEGTKTTYNVGTITGGTSVNTIAQKASFLCEYRSNDVDCLDAMKAHYERIFRAAQSDKVHLEVKPVGERPCAKNVNASEVEALASLYAGATEKVTGIRPRRCAESTDANISLSLGVPAICVGAMISGGTHTTEEWLEKESLPIGLEVVLRFLFELFA